MKRKILSLVLAIALCFAMVLPTYAADSSVTFIYNLSPYNVTKVVDSDILEATVGEVESGMKNGALHDGNGTYFPQVTSPMLYYNNKLLQNISTQATLAGCGISSGDTIYVYNSTAGVNVNFEGKDYFVELTDFNVDTLKNAIANGVAQGIPNAPAADKQNLYDKDGDLLTSSSITPGATVYLYNKDSGKITDVNEGNNQHKKPVTAKYSTGAAAATTYSVEITWGSMEFDYKVPDKEWNPETHREEEVAGSGGWTCKEGANKITVKNHSNENVKVAFAFKENSQYYNQSPNDGFTQVDVSENGDNVLTGNAIVLVSAHGTEVNAAPTVIAELNLSGKLTDDPGTNAIGHVTVTISATTT
ncbi:MAG: hypothetical protein IJW76_03635 [Clostridia bacterium]|nr:hypothetical protein [Clostridia bacterium]